MSRNRVRPEAQVAASRYYAGSLTFNAPPPEDYEGHIVIFATVRIGDHAHIDVYTGWQSATQDGQLRPTMHYGHAGRLVFAWDRWVEWRDQMADEATPQYLIREVENPTRAQLESKP